MDNTLVKYNIKDSTKHVFEETLDDLHENFNYPEIVKASLFASMKNSKFIYMNNAVWDVDKGTMLKLAEGCIITQAVKGY